MLYRRVLESSSSEKTMKEMVLKINRQLKQEKVSTRDYQTRIFELEKNIIALGIDPKDPTVVGDLMKIKDTEIKFLKKRLNIPEEQNV